MHCTVWWSYSSVILLPTTEPMGEYVMKLTSLKNIFCLLFCSPRNMVSAHLCLFRDRRDSSLEQLRNKRSANLQGREWKGDNIKETELQMVWVTGNVVEILLWNDVGLEVVFEGAGVAFTFQGRAWRSVRFLGEFCIIWARGGVEKSCGLSGV